jgi:hypothetical protein
MASAIDIPCPNKACRKSVSVSRTKLRAGSVKCKACDAEIVFAEGSGKKIAAQLDAVDRAMKG